MFRIRNCGVTERIGYFLLIQVSLTFQKLPVNLREFYVDKRINYGKMEDSDLEMR